MSARFWRTNGLYYNYIESLHFDYVEIETFMGFMLKQTAQESIKVLYT